MPPSAAFLSAVPVCVIDQHLAHRPRGYGHEMGSAGPGRRGVSYQPDISFMNQRRWLQRVILPLMLKNGSREPPELVVNDRQQRVTGRIVASIKCVEHARKVLLLLWLHVVLTAPEPPLYPNRRGDGTHFGVTNRFLEISLRLVRLFRADVVSGTRLGGLGSRGDS